MQLRYIMYSMLMLLVLGSYSSLNASVFSFFKQGFCKNLVGSEAPAFQAQAAVVDQVQSISLNDFPDKYKILFFYPADFTFVCPTEIRAFQDKLETFTQLNAQIIAVSVDPIETHLKWLQTPKDDGGIQGVKYPIVADPSKNITANYGLLTVDEGKEVALRGLFIIDKNNIIQHMEVNNLPLGRSTDEALRLLKAIQVIDANGGAVVCPANFQADQDKPMAPSTEGVIDYFSTHDHASTHTQQ